MKSKILLLLTFFFLLFNYPAFGAIKLIEKKLVEGVLVHSICVDGYKFLHAVYASGELFTQFIQVYETKKNETRPATCEIKTKKEKKD